MKPADGVTLDEAARIIGVARSTVQALVLAGRLSALGMSGKHRRLSQADVEDLALQMYDWRRHADDPETYRLSSHQAAEMLGISRQRLGQLGDKGFVPFLRNRDGVRLYRREQLLTIANARTARWH